MEFTTPRVFHLAGTAIDYGGLRSYLAHIGAEGWDTDARSAGEILTEVAGKLCYRSFHEDLNANLTKVRRMDNAGYLDNILKHQHGAVLEHVSDTYVLVGVSRVLTHEMVRHRLCGFSQESLRFVRLTELQAYFPDVFGDGFLADQFGAEAPALSNELRRGMRATFEYLEDVQLQLANRLDLDGLRSFERKKKLTSAMRRLAPIGLATTLMMTTNARNWRHIIAQRTSRHAEEEIRKVAARIYRDQQRRHPNIYQDAEEAEVDGVVEVTFRHGRA